MAAASIEGITIKIGCDVSDLKEEMSQTTDAIKDVGDAAKTDIAAANAPVKNLKDSFKETAVNAVKVAAACMVIGKAIGGFVKGALEDAIKTDPEAVTAVESMKDAFSELKTSLGEALLPVIKEAAPVITDLLNNVTTFIDAHPNLAMGIMAVVTVAALGLMVFAALAPVFAVAGVAIGAISAPILIVCGVIALLIVAGIALKTHWSEITEWCKTAWENVKISLTASIDAIKLKFDEWKSKLNVLKANLIGFKESVVTKFTEIKTAVSTALDPETLIQKGKDFVDSIVSGIQTRIDEVKDSIKQKLLELLPDWARDLITGGGGGGSTGIGATASNPMGIPGYPGRAGGGSVYAGHPYIIGEVGPELFVPQTNGYVVPNDHLQDYGTTINVNLGNVYGESYLRDYVISAVTGAIRQEVRLGA